MPRNNYEAARVLVNATLRGDKAAAKKFDITLRTIRNYREALVSDPELSAFFQEMLERATDGWVSSLRTTLQVTARRLRDFVELADLTNVEHVREIRLIFNSLAETAVLREALIDESAGDDSQGAFAPGHETTERENQTAFGNN